MDFVGFTPQEKYPGRVTKAAASWAAATRAEAATWAATAGAWEAAASFLSALKLRVRHPAINVHYNGEKSLLAEALNT